MAHGKEHFQLQPKTNTNNTIVSSQRSLWNFSDENLFPFHKFHTIPDVPAHSQEPIIINELLHCLVGVRGTYIVPVENTINGLQEVTFTVSNKIDNSIRDIVQEVRSVGFVKNIMILKVFGFRFYHWLDIIRRFNGSQMK